MALLRLPRLVLDLLKRTFSNFSNDRCPSMAAAIAFYTLFSLPPLLVLIVMILGTVLSRETIETGIVEQLQDLMGTRGAEQVSSILQQGKDFSGSGVLATTLSIGALIFSATGVFAELQSALNIAWRVAPDPKSGGLKQLLFKRILSFGMVLGIAFILLVSLVLSALITAFGDFVTNRFDTALSPGIMYVIDLTISFVVITLVLGGIFKYLPDAKIGWKDVEVGALGSAFMFLLGKFIIGFYLGRSNPGEAFGAAGSLAVLLIWVYYSSMIVLFGAEFTCVWAEQRGGGIVPERGAIRTEKAGAVAPREDPEDTRATSRPNPNRRSD